MIQLNEDYLTKFITEEELNFYENEVNAIHQDVYDKKSIGSEYLGWLEENLKEQLVIDDIKDCKQQLLKFSPEILIVIGVGGSYLGTRALDQALSPYFENKKQLQIIYAGFNMSGEYMHELIEFIKTKNVVLNVISKSGSTFETLIGFRTLEKYMQENYGEEAKDRIIVTTNDSKGYLKEVSINKGYAVLNIPDNIGGRFSVLTPVGLFPLAMRDHDIEALLNGANVAKNNLLNQENEAYRYAVLRHILYEKGYQVEVLGSFEPKLKYLHEWWKQLFAESEGKNGKGIFPASVSYSTDLHALGQYIQDGSRIIFETLLKVKDLKNDKNLYECEDNLDGLNYLADKSYNEINAISKEGAAKAHYEGGVPVIQIEIPNLDAYHLGYLIHFFMESCMMSAYLLKVNPFDQPGVEAYKNETIQLLKDSD